jgi:hypothetical protein
MDVFQQISAALFLVAVITLTSECSFADTRVAQVAAETAASPAPTAPIGDTSNDKVETAPLVKPAHPFITTMECVVKFQAAKAAGMLNGQKWSDFRKAGCGLNDTAVPAAAVTKPAVAPEAPMSAGNAAFPSAIDPKYTKESKDNGQTHTCADQFDANKATGSNGGLKWIQKGGGYYFECKMRLKASN